MRQGDSCAQDTLRRAAEAMRERGKGVALTGAGISAESGISTYRDPGGLWDRYAEGAGGGMLAVLAGHPDQAPQILSDFFSRLERAEPNPGHMALVELESMGLLRSVVTQNVDNLHRQAGSRRVYELHGNIYRLRCTACGERMLLERSASRALAQDVVQKVREFSLAAIAKVMPRCRCGGTMRPDFVGFGEPVQELEQAINEAASCDWMLIVGTSGVVYPAASLPRHAKEHGAFIMEVNPKESEFSSWVDVFIHGMAGEVLPRLVTEVKQVHA